MSPSPFREVAAEMDRIFTNIQMVVQPAVKESFTTRCLHPVISILSLVPPINERLLLRKNLLSDYDTLKAKMQKKAVTNSGGSDAFSKKMEKFDELTAKLNMVHGEICTNLDEFELARPVTLGPELASFIGCFHSFASFLHSSSSSVLPCIPQAASTINSISVTAMDMTLRPVRNRYSMRTTKIPDGYMVPRENIKRVEPLLSRPACAGGTYGGYGQLASCHELAKDLCIKEEESGFIESDNDISSTSFVTPEVPITPSRTSRRYNAAISSTPVDLAAVSGNEENEPVLAANSGGIGIDSECESDNLRSKSDEIDSARALASSDESGKPSSLDAMGIAAPELPPRSPVPPPKPPRQRSYQVASDLTQSD
eukprot:scaffold3290_cov165-Ochromonas_danica.AAC.22